jgi:hypothetical protein
MDERVAPYLDVDEEQCSPADNVASFLARNICGRRADGRYWCRKKTAYGTLYI